MRAAAAGLACAEMLTGPAASGPWATGSGAAHAWLLQAGGAGGPSRTGTPTFARSLPEPTWGVPGLGLEWPFGVRGAAPGAEVGGPLGLGGFWRLFAGGTTKPTNARATAAKRGAGATIAAASTSSQPQPRATAVSQYPPFSLGSWGAGYVAYAPQGQKFTEVYAVFVLPSAPAAGGAPAAAASGWVSIWTGIGISASGSTQLMQAGVSMESENGAWSYSAPWWINESSAAPPPHPMGLKVAPGDRVAVDVKLIDPTTNTWSFTVTDQASGQSETDRCTGCVSAQDTAGWVVEDPSFAQQYTDYADPGSVTFVTAEAAVVGGPLQPLPLTDWRTLLRQPGDGSQQGPLAAPAADGAFTVGEMARTGA